MSNLRLSLTKGLSIRCGPIPLTIVDSGNGNMTVSDLGGGVYRATKTSGVDDWANASVISQKAFVGNFVVRINPRQTNKFMMIGVNADPNTDRNFTSIDRALYIGDAGALELYENGVQLSSGYSYTASDYLFIRRIEGAITVHKGATIDIADATQVATFTNLTGDLYVDSSFHTIDGAADIYAVAS